MSQASELNPLHVANYLQQYPEFFNNHAELLETLAIPHPASGNVVSLVAKQLEIFRAKQHELENQLHTLLEIARDNDICAGRMHQLTLTLLNSANFETAVNNLTQVLMECFLVDFVALKIIQENTNYPGLERFFVAPSHENLAYLTVELVHKKPRCGRLNVAQNKFLFAEAASAVKSSAIIPILHPDLTALLVIGSRDETRFHYSMGNLFLNQLAEMLGIRLATLLAQ